MNIQRIVFTVIAIVLLIGVAWLSLHQIQVMIYKFALVTCAGILGFWLDVILFPHFRPDKSMKLLDGNKLGEHNEYLLVAAIQIRRALIILAVVIGISLGL